MTGMKRLLSVAAAAMLLWSAPSRVEAQISTFDDVDYWVGSGSNEAVLVVNWWNGTSSDGSYAWGYRWDGSVTAFDMFNAVFTSQPALWGWQAATGFPNGVFGLAFDPTYSGLTWTFGHSNEPWPTPDTLGTADPGVLMSEGWNSNGFWNLYNGGVSLTMPTTYSESFDPGLWFFSDVGLSDITLEDGQWIGFGFDPDYSHAETAIPTFAYAAIPEPGSALLVIIGLGALGYAKRSRVHAG